MTEIAAGIFYSLNATVLIAIVVSGIFWSLRLFHYLKHGAVQPLVSLEMQSHPTWNLAAFLVMFGSQIVVTVLLINTFRLAGFIGDSAEPTISLGLLIANALGGLTGMGLTIVWLRQNSSVQEFGFGTGAGDIWLGLKSCIWFLPPVMLVSIAASVLMEYEHPVLDKLAENADLLMFGVLFVTTAVVAPLVEEFMFRVLLQGGLQKFFDGPLRDLQNEDIVNEEVDDPSATLQAGENENWLGDAYQPPAASSSLQNGRLWTPRSFWPIVLTSIVFAAMHIGQGAAFIPLFFLSLGLGYLYQRTGRITAPLVVHAVLNSLTMCVEFSRIGAGISAP